MEAILPDRFDTPMFWAADELRELAGTAVVGVWRVWGPVGAIINSLHPALDKIGKDEAEHDFSTKLLPAVEVGRASRTCSRRRAEQLAEPSGPVPA